MSENKNTTEVITQRKTDNLTDDNIVEGARVQIHSFDYEGTVVDAETPKVKIDDEEIGTVELDEGAIAYQYNRAPVSVLVEETATVTVPDWVDVDVDDDPTNIKGVGKVTAGGCETVGELIYYSREDEIPAQAPQDIKVLVVEKENWMEAEQEVVIDEDYIENGCESEQNVTFGIESGDVEEGDTLFVDGERYEVEVVTPEGTITCVPAESGFSISLTYSEEFGWETIDGEFNSPVTVVLVHDEERSTFGLVEELSDEIESNSVFSPAQSQVVACKRLGLSHSGTAEMLDKPKGTVKATWQACKTKWENAVWTVEEMGDVFQ